MADIREKIMEFERQRQALVNISMQKQQLESSLLGIDKTLEELGNTNEEKVYKAVGNILVLRDKKEVQKELEDTKETTALRVKTVEKQEKSLLDKLNGLRSEIEAEAGKEKASASKGDSTVIAPKKKDA